MEDDQRSKWYWAAAWLRCKSQHRRHARIFDNNSRLSSVIKRGDNSSRPHADLGSNGHLARARNRTPDKTKWWSDLDDQMTYALIDLYGVATGTNNLNKNERMHCPAVNVGTGGDQGNFSKTQHPFEDNATVSKLLGDLF
jgi:hypothetical protein